jgi:hypothetical protein
MIHFCFCCYYNTIASFSCPSSSIILLREEGTFAVLPSGIGLIGFSPSSCRILLPLADSIKSPKEIAPSRFLTVDGMANEK